jgi:hypothetical protein
LSLCCLLGSLNHSQGFIGELLHIPGLFFVSVHCLCLDVFIYTSHWACKAQTKLLLLLLSPCPGFSISVHTFPSCPVR